MNLYRIKAVFYLRADSSDEAVDALRDGMNSALNNGLEIWDVWSKDE
jgi:hypothetical protein